MGRDERAVDARYNEQDPAAVAVALPPRPTAWPACSRRWTTPAWARTGTYSYPEPALRDVDWIARHTVHELHHHLADVDRVLLAVLET